MSQQHYEQGFHLNRSGLPQSLSAHMGKSSICELPYQVLCKCVFKNIVILKLSRKGNPFKSDGFETYYFVSNENNSNSDAYFTLHSKKTTKSKSGIHNQISAMIVHGSKKENEIIQPMYDPDDKFSHVLLRVGDESFEVSYQIKWLGRKVANLHFHIDQDIVEARNSSGVDNALEEEGLAMGKQNSRTIVSVSIVVYYTRAFRASRINANKEVNSHSISCQMYSYI